MLFVNNPEALVAIEMERRNELGLHSTASPDLTSPGVVVQESNRARPAALRFRSRAASTGYAAS